MQVVTEDIRLVEPFSKWIKQDQQSELLDERLLFPFVFTGLSYDGEPAHFAFLDLRHFGLEREAFNVILSL